jgi:sugar phosphate isomerase/epimerase
MMCVAKNIMNTANMDDFALDSCALAGSLQTKLSAVCAAGFTQISLSASDLVNHADGVDSAMALVKASGLRVCSFQAACDFEGAQGHLHAYKLEVMKQLLGLCQALGCHVLVLPSTALSSNCQDDELVVRNLRQLAMLAIPLNIKIAYQAWPGATYVKDFLQAWELVCTADMPNLGLCLDTYDLLAQNKGLQDLLADLDMLDPSRLLLVQLADQLGNTSDFFRVLPGNGAHRDHLAAVVNTLHQLGYRGDYSLCAFNADYSTLPPQHVARQALACAQWLGQDVLRRSVPLTNQLRLRRTLAA